MPSVRKGGRRGPYRSVVEVLSWPISNDLYLSVHYRHRGMEKNPKLARPAGRTPKIKIDVVSCTSTRSIFVCFC